MISERPINRSEIVLHARVVGGIQMIDGSEADDKIIAVLENDNYWGEVTDISGLPERLLERLQHYFSTYKLVSGKPNHTSIEGVYHSDHTIEVVNAAILDYEESFRYLSGET